MHTSIKRFALAVALAFTGAVTGHTEKVDAPPTQSALLEVLTSKETAKADKAITCKKLAVYGDDECIDDVAALLVDPELNSWARITLEAIGSPDAQAALIEAIQKTEGLNLVGIVNSLGVLAAPGAVEPLTALLESEDKLVAQCSAVSLGKIGGESSETTLTKALADSSADVRSAIAEGLVLSAEQRMAAGQLKRAAELYDTVLAADVPQPRIVEATRGAILSRGPQGVDMLVEKLGSDNERIRFAALSCARQIEGEGIVELLKEAISEVPVDQKPLYLIALGDRGGESFIDSMLAAVKSDKTEVRLAAIGVLEKTGDSSCVESLLEAAGDDVTMVAQAAKQTLAKLDNEAIDDEIQSRLDDAEGDSKVLLIELLGARRIDAIDFLMSAAGDDETAVQEAALSALGQVATLEQIPVLLERATSGVQDGNGAAMKALQAACVRQADQAACAKILSDAMQGADPETQLSILETVAAMGGPDALAVLGKVAMDGSTTLKDAATRLLGNWMSVDAGEPLAAVAQQPTNPYRIRAARGYLRLVRQFVMKNPQRHAMMTKALEFVERKEEKELLLDAAGRYPSFFMLKTVASLSSDSTVAEKAKATGISIARKINGNQQVAKILKTIGVESIELEITQANYGAGEQQKDVTKMVQAAAGDFPMVVLDKPSFNENFGGDPAPGRPKFLSVNYKANGQSASAMIRENMSIILDAP